MKTKYSFLLYILPMLFIFACAKENNNRNTGVTPYPNNGYYLSNGQCYSNTGAVAPITYCNQQGNTGYYMSGNLCYSNAGQQVDLSLCNNTNGYRYINGQCYNSMNQPVSLSLCSNGSGNGTAIQCVGTHYYYNPYMGWAPVNCSTTSCSGYTLMNSQYQTVRCL